MEGIFTRLPIYDRKGRNFGYEFRSCDGAPISESMLEKYGLERPTLTTLGKNVDLDSLPQIQGVKNFIIVREDRDAPEFIALLTALGERGYRVVLPEHLFDTHRFHIGRHCKGIVIAPHVRLDMFIQQKIVEYKRLGLRVFGVDIDSYAMYNRCVSFGFDFLQGMFYTKSSSSDQHAVPTSRARLLAMMSRLQDPSISVEEIENLVALEPALTFKLLKIVNSVSSGLAEPIESLRRAILFLGVNKISSLASLMALKDGSKKSADLITTALVRAKMCEEIAMLQKLDTPERFFTAGVMSILEAIFDVPLEDLIGQIPLTSELRAALLDPYGTSNKYSNVLRTVYSFERGNFDQIESAEALHQAWDAYKSSMVWAEQSAVAA